MAIRFPDMRHALAQVGPHERAISAVFRGRMAFTGEAPVIDKPLVLIAFTNRSGSNYLGELMRSTDRLRGMGEGLNSDLVAKRAEAWGLGSLPDYMARLNEGRVVPFGLKASWDQMLMLMRHRIDAMFDRVEVVHIHRRDIVRQAISREIAWQTKKWTSATEVPEDIVPRYDRASIDRHVAAIARDEERLALVMAAFDLRVTHIAYEDLAGQPDQILRHVMATLSLPCAPDWGLRPTRLQRQADDHNADFLDRYRSDLRSLALGI